MPDKQRPKAQLKLYASSMLPTSYGQLKCHVYKDEAGGESICLVKGKVAGLRNVLCRIHSECLTGEVFSSTKCDCKQQLEAALTLISEAKEGVLIYLRQEGRGIGLGNKIRAYAEQEKGLDTVDANRALGLPDDARVYGNAAAILDSLGVKSVALLTNNPQKIAALHSAGIDVTRRVQNIQAPSKEAEAYLEVKKRKMGHLGYDND